MASVLLRGMIVVLLSRLLITLLLVIVLFSDIAVGLVVKPRIVMMVEFGMDIWRVRMSGLFDLSILNLF